jgi:hypothetical protein
MKAIFAKLLGISKQLLDWLLILVSTQAAVSLTKLLPVALSIVTELATTGLSNKDKQQEAVKKLTDAATVEGISAGLNIINLAVEMAVAQMKASTTK